MSSCCCEDHLRSFTLKQRTTSVSDSVNGTRVVLKACICSEWEVVDYVASFTECGFMHRFFFTKMTMSRLLH